MSQIIKAVLGPTNTGKTHYAIERMLSYTSGMMGFPLRLLAREVYDRVVAIKGKNQVALVTGEERIVPEGARYWLATVEALPRHVTVDFVAIDEIQMAADRERGHVFTDHLLHRRGRFETLLLGAETMRPLISRLLPDAEIITRPRYSTLRYTKPVKLSRLPRRSAVVAFSAHDVYGLAELMKRNRGGAAIVMGALSPRTRNAQVELYQSGEVDYLIATDAIGMGLNMDIAHLSLAALDKFDGRHMRALTPAEVGQIAGRAGRYRTDGSFSTLSGGDPLDPLVVAQVEEHRYNPVKTILWRSARMDMRSVPALVRSLERPTDIDGLSRQRDAQDLLYLKRLADDSEVMDRAGGADAVKRLWDVCQVPDFRKLAAGDHLSLLKRLFLDLTSVTGKIDEDLIARAVKRVDNIHGDIDTLAGRISSIRVWTYVSHRAGWLADGGHWAHVTRGVEDKLSDALHDKLTQRFVDRRTAVLLRSLRKKGDLSVTVDRQTGRVTVEGQEIGTLKGFSFFADENASAGEQKMLNAAAEAALRTEVTRQAKLFANVGFKVLELDVSQGLDRARLTWEGAQIATLAASGNGYGLRVTVSEPHLLQSGEVELVTRKAQEWIDTRLAEKLEPLLKLSAELNGDVEVPEGSQALSGMARGIAFQLLENYGTLDRKAVQNDLKALDQDARKGLRRFGVRFGSTSLYIPLILKPHATELRLILWAMHGGHSDLPAIPTPGMVWVDVADGAPEAFYALAGFRGVGTKAVRMDMIERLADAVRPLGAGNDWFDVTPEIMGLVGLSGDDFAATMASLGYVHEIRHMPAAAKLSAPEQTTEKDGGPGGEQAETLPAAEGSSQESSAQQGSGEEAVATPEAHEASTPETVDTEGPDAAGTETAGTDAAAQVDLDSAAPAAKSAPEESGTPDDDSSDSSNTAESDDATAAPSAEDAVTGDAEAELVARHVFRWKPARRDRAPQKGRGRRNDGDGQQRRGQPNRKTGGGKAGGKSGPRSDYGRPGGGKSGGGKTPRKDKPLDPDSPFAALAALKDSLGKK